MAQYILAYLATAFVFLAIDVVWLKWIARRFYAAELAGLLREKPFLEKDLLNLQRSLSNYKRTSEVG